MKLRSQIAILLLCLLGNFAFAANTRANTNNNLTVTVDGLKSQKGQVCFSVFSTGRGFPSDGKRSLKAKCTKIAQTPVQFNFSNLKAGSYAVAIIHDVNGDGTLNRNFLGIPTEGFGFSNNPKITSGPPKFNESAVFVAGPHTNINIQLQYLLGG